MKKFFVATLALALLTLSQAGAGTMAHNMMMPSCAPGDKVVGMNMMTHNYMTHHQMMKKMAGMSKSQMHMMMEKNHMKMMCMSKAKMMGGHMMGGPGM
jgi:hypothetical protein